METKTGRKLGLKGIRKRWLLSFIMVLGIPAAGFIFALYYTKVVVTREIVQSNLTINNFIKSTIDDRFENGAQIAANIILDKRFRQILIKDNTWQDIVVQQGDLINLFRYYKAANPGIDILIYISDLNYIITVDTANQIDRLHAALTYLGHYDIDESEWENLLVNAGEKPQYISSPYLSYNAFGRQALAYCTNTNQPVFGNSFKASIIATMRYDFLEDDLYQENRDSAILILDSAGIPVYSYGMEVPDLKINLEENKQGYQIIKYLGNDYVVTFRRSAIIPFAYAVMTRQTSFWNLYNTLERIIIQVMIAALVLGLITALSLLQFNYRPLLSVMRTLGLGNRETADENEYEIIRKQVLSLTDDRNRMENDLKKQDRFLNEYNQLLSEAFEFRTLDDACKIINDFFIRLSEFNYPFQILRYYTFSLVSMLIKKLSPDVWETNNHNIQDILDSMAGDGNQILLRQSFLRFIRIFYPETRENDREGIFPRINSFILEHYDDINLNLTMIADNIGLSVKYISKLFKIETGQGLLNYIGTVRINKAKELLDESHYSLNEIAVMTGYSSVKTFRRIFQKMEKINPSEYRLAGKH